MRKIFIVGTVASGKTTLAKRLSKKLNTPWYELDDIVYHRTTEGRTKRTPEEQLEVIKNIDVKAEWIFEGTDRKSYQVLYDMADIVIFLNTSLRKRKTRIFTRFLKQKIGVEKSHYKPDFMMLKSMYQWTSDFERERHHFEKKLSKYNEKIITLTDSNNANIERIMSLMKTRS